MRALNLSIPVLLINPSFCLHCSHSCSIHSTNHFTISMDNYLHVCVKMYIHIHTYTHRERGFVSRFSLMLNLDLGIGVEKDHIRAFGSVVTVKEDQGIVVI